MAEQDRRYKNAPITEAVIDLRVELPEETTVEALRELHTRLSDTYAPPKDIYEGTATFGLNPGGPFPLARAVRSLRGYRFDRTDERRVMTAKLDGFSYSALAPYDNWETFSREAKGLWKLYRDTYHPLRVTRVAVRYINRINIPLDAAGPNGSIQLEDYLKTHPRITDGLTYSAMAGFIMQVQIPQPDIESTLLVNQAVVESPHPSAYFSVVLDLDLFRVVGWNPNDDDLVWGFFDKLRGRKNQAFEASITDKTRELFE